MGSHEKLKLFRCKICSLEFTTLTAARTHSRNHEQKRSPILPQKIDDILPVNIERLLIVKDFQCEKCLTRFPSKNLLHVHFQSVHLDSKPKCLVCPFERNSVHNVLKHMRLSHEKLKLFRCKICSLEFTTLTAARTHSKNHCKQQNSGPVKSLPI